MIAGHKRKDIQFWTWYYSCLKTWFWNSFYETGKITGFKPDIIPVYEPGSETAIMKLEKYLVWSNLELFQVCNKPGFETPWFLVHFKSVYVWRQLLPRFSYWGFDPRLQTVRLPKRASKLQLIKVGTYFASSGNRTWAVRAISHLSARLWFPDGAKCVPRP